MILIECSLLAFVSQKWHAKLTNARDESENKIIFRQNEIGV